MAESHWNLEKILNILNLNDLHYFCAFDMKFANIFLGIECAASTHPCLWCNISKEKMQNFQTTVRSEHWEVYVHQLIFTKPPVKIKKIQAFSCILYCVNRPLVDLPDDVMVIKILKWKSSTQWKYKQNFQ